MTFQSRRIQYSTPTPRPPSASSAPACRSVEAAAVLWLAALGAARRRPVNAEAVQSLILDLGEGWAPCQDVILACVEEMLRAEVLAVEPATGTLLPGEEADLAFVRLMAAPPEAGPGPLARVGTRLRLAFLDLLPVAERPAVLDGLLLAAEAEMKQAVARPDAWSGPYGGRWRMRDLTEAASRLDLLRRLRAEATEAAHVRA